MRPSLLTVPFKALLILCTPLSWATPNWTEVIEHSNQVTASPIAQAQTSLFPQQSATLRYMGIVPAVMTVQRQQNQYEITMTLHIPFKKIVFRSVGNIIDNKQLQPTLFQDLRNDKIYAQADFDYAKKEIRQAKGNDSPSVTPMVGQALDPFSLAWQLTLNQGVLNAPIQLATGKGNIQSYAPEALSSETTTRATGSSGTVMNVQQISLAHTKSHHYGLAIDVGYLPVVFDFDNYAMTIEHINMDGKDYWPTAASS